MSNLIVPGYFTELSAVNYVLRAIGESPIASLPATQADVQMILGCFNDVAAEVQASQQWSFNSEIGYQLQPAGQLTWNSPNQGDVETLNVFQVPATMASYRPTPSYQQTGPQYTDIGYRISSTFLVGGLPALIFYDRAKNREGFNAGAYPFLALDVGWFTPFVNLPYVAQLYICAKTARRTVEQNVNSAEIAGFVKTDEAWSFKLMMREFGFDDSYNALRTVNAFRAYGNRPATNVGFIDIRGQAPAQNAVVGPLVACTSSSGTSNLIAPHSTSGNTFTFTITNTNTMAVNVSIGINTSGSVTTAVPQYLSANIPGNGALTVIGTYTTNSTIGASSGSMFTQIVTFVIGTAIQIGSLTSGTYTVTTT